MKYTKFEIENFKGIESLELDLNKKPISRIFTLVGLNESGKTTILEAIDFFKNDTDTDNSFKFIPKSKKSNFNGAVSVKATISFDENDIKEIKQEVSENLNFRIENLSKEIVINKKYIFESSKYKETKNLWTIKIEGKRVEETSNEEGELIEKTSEIIEITSSDSEWKEITKIIEEKFPEIIYYPDFLFDFPSKIYLEKTPNEDKQQPFYREILQDILDSLNDDLTLENHVVNRIKENTEESNEALESLLDKMSSKVTKTIFEAWENMFKRRIRKEIVFKYANKSGANYIEVKLKENSESYNIDERSLGFKWFFTFLLFTEFRKNRSKDYGETIFLLDEPAYNLHSTAQTKLLNTFEDLTFDSCSLIYTTHSHHLINPNWLPTTFIVKNEGLDYSQEEEFTSNNTNVKAINYRNFLAKHPTEKDYFQPILDKLEYQPSKLEQVEKIIITEGKYDYYTFKYINEILLENKYPLKIYPGASVDKLGEIFRLYLAWGKDFKAIFDSDTGGKKAKKRYCKEISNELNELIFTLEDINSSWKDYKTESLFKESEKINIIKKVFGSEENTYNKTKFNNSIQELFLNKEKVEISKKTLEKFEEIFEKIKFK